MSTYLVTGASRGLGYAFVQSFAADQANNVIGIVRDKVSTEKKLAKDGIKNVVLFEADIGNLATLKVAAKEIESKYGNGINYLIANAALVSKTTALRTLADFNENPETLEQDLLDSFQINFIGLINTINAFIPAIRRGSVKKVVVISSGMADTDFVKETTMDVGAPYAITKAGVNMVIAKYSAMYTQEGILFMAICPGSVDTAAQAWNPDEITVSEAEKLKEFGAKLIAYAPTFTGSVPPEEAVRDVMNVVNQASLAKGDGGIFISHSGTKRWL